MNRPQTRKIVSKALSLVISAVFLLNQIAWADGAMPASDRPLLGEKQKEQLPGISPDVFAKHDLEKQDLVSMKNAVENFIKPSNLASKPGEKRAYYEGGRYISSREFVCDDAASDLFGKTLTYHYLLYSVYDDYAANISWGNISGVDVKSTDGQEYSYDVLYSKNPNSIDATVTGIVKKDDSTGKAVSKVIQSYCFAPPWAAIELYPNADDPGLTYYFGVRTYPQRYQEERVCSLKLNSPTPEGILAFDYFYYDDLSTVKTCKAYADSNFSTLLAEYSYDNSGVVTQYKDARSGCTYKYFASSGRVQEKIYGDGTIEQYIDEDWDGTGRGRLLKRSSGEYCQIYRDYFEGTAQARYVDYYDHLLFATEEFDRDGHLLVRKEPYGSTTHYFTSGRIKKVVDDHGFYRDYLDEDWNGTGRGRLVEFKEFVYRFNYKDYYPGTNQYRLKEVSHIQDGLQTIYEYDRLGNVTEVYTPYTPTPAPTLGLLSDAYVYGPDYQLSYRVSSADMETTTVTENLTLTRGWNTVTREAQDPFGHTRQMTWKIYLDQNAERGLSYDYDAVGNLKRQTTFNGEDITFIYDANNRPTAIKYPEYPGVEFSYDNIGELTRESDSHGNTDYTYDIAGRLSSVTLPGNQRLGYAYDLSGRVTQVSYAGKTVNYVYDAAGRLISVVDGTDTTTYSYNAAGDLISTTLPNGVRTTYEYDNAADLTRVCHEKVTPASGDQPETIALIAEFSYTLNAAGERVQMIETRPGATRTVDYTYDAFKRLTREADSLYGITNYTYDNAGNRLSKESIPPVITADTPRIFTWYTYGVDNRLTDLTETTTDASGTQLSTNTQRFVYDAAGNLRQRITPDKVYYYEFDSRNLLVRFNDGLNETTYDYDGDGNRISKTVNGVKTSYLIDPTSSIPQVLAEIDNSGNLTKTYAFGADRLSSTLGNTAQYYLQDGLGSSIGLTSSDGTTLETYNYDAFGNIRSQTTSQNFLYTGEQRDAETGLIYLRARYYDPALGRFISRDPQYIGKQTETQSLNPFIYVQNDPVNYLDPLGLAYSGKKALSISPMMLNNPVLDLLDLEVSHEHWFFDKPQYINGLGYVTNVGWGPNTAKNPSGLFTEPNGLKGYQLGMFHYDDVAIAKVINDIGHRNYNVILKNCQGGITASRMLYFEYQIQNTFRNLKDNVSNMFGNSSSENDQSGKAFDYIFNSAYNNNDEKYIWGNGGDGGDDGFGGGFNNGGLGSWFDGYNSDLFNTSYFSPFDLGGVYMDKALSIIGQNINNIHGVSYDPLTGQIIMFSDTGESVPEIPVDYFLAALKAVFGNQATSPGVSIDPVKDASGNYDPTKDQTVRFLGGIENTALGKAVCDADLLMKLLAIGSDNVTKTNIRPNGENISESYISQYIPGFKDLFSLSADVTDPSILTGSRNLRCWFVPKDMKLVKSADGNAFVFDDTSVKLMTETSFVSSGASQTIPDDPRAVAFVQFFNAHFPELAEIFPEFRELEKGMRAVGLAKFIKDNNIPVDLDWLSKANITPVATPATTPTASMTRTVTVNGTGQQVSLTISGGVDYSLFDGKNFQYLLDTDSQASGLHDAAQTARANDTTQSWSVTMNGSTYQASAFSLAPTKKDGNFSWGGTDLAYSTPGGMPLVWQRYYDSFEAGNKAAMGSGWDYMPYALHFPVAKNIETFTLNGNASSVDIYPSIYLSDKAGGGYVLFDPMGIQSDGRVFYASEDQRIGSQILYLNTDCTYTLVRGGSTVNFTSDGRLTTLRDNNQNTIEYVYDTNKRLIRIDDGSSDRSIAVLYDAQGKILKVTGADNRSVSYTYDTQKGDLIRIIQDWSGRFVDLTYDADHRLLAAVDRDNRDLFTNTYDLLGRVTSQTNAIGTQVDSTSNLLTQTTQHLNAASGSSSKFIYDDKFRVVGRTDTFGNQTQYQYADNSFNVRSVTDPLGNSQSFEYDVYGNLISATDALGNRTRYYYETNSLGTSRLTLVEQANGYCTLYGYDAKGNVSSTTEGCRIQSINNDGSITVSTTNLKTTYSYDPQGRLTKSVDPGSSVTEYIYDDAGNVIKTKRGQIDLQTAEYLTRDGIVTGLVAKAADALGRAITFGYDSVSDLVTSVTTPLGTTLNHYDPRNRQTDTVDALGRQTQFVYNSKDQLTGTVEAGSSTTTADDIISNFAYNALGQLANIAGPLGAVTNFAYDLGGRIAKLMVDENAKNYASAGVVNVSDVGEDVAGIAFTVGSDVNQVTIHYKKNFDAAYQALVITDPVVGDNKVTLQGLSGDTKYDFEIQYKDGEGDISYSRKYDLKTKVPELPVIDKATVQTVSDTTATIKADISKDIRDARIKYHVRGETTSKTLFTQSVRDAKTNGLVFDLENLRSGLDYDAEITITDRFGVTSEIKTISFKTTGNLSPNDSAIHAVSGFGKVLATLTTQVYISLYHEKLTNPYAEQYNITVRDAQGNPVNWTAQGASIGTMDNGLLINGLSANTQYSYTILVTSRADIAPVSGTFKTAPGGDTAPPQTSSMSFGPKDPTSLVYGITPLESLKALLVTLTDQVTQIIKKYYFFDIATSVAKVFLLDGLDAGKRYLIKWLMFDTSGNISASNMNIILSTPVLDETPPAVGENTLVERTDTTATFHLVSGEPIKKLRVRYRLVGDALWAEQILIPVGLAFDVSLTGLMPGKFYEYQYVFEDNAGNQALTEWEKV